MSTYDDFIHVSTGDPKVSRWPGGSSVSRDYFDNSKGLRVFTEGAITDSIAKNHPKHHITNVAGQPALLGFAEVTEGVSASPTTDQSIIQRYYLPPARRIGDTKGVDVALAPVFAVYDYKYKDTEFLLYIVRGQDVYLTTTSFLLTPLIDDSSASLELAEAKADELLKAVAQWNEDLHGEVLVFDQGIWRKNKELYDNVQKANWEDVILDKEKKDTIMDDVLGFFKSGERYAEYGVPWKVSNGNVLNVSYPTNNCAREA